MRPDEPQLLNLIVSKAILETQENERKRIAEELHDGLGNMLSILKLNLTSLQESYTGPYNFLLQNSFTLLEESFRELKSISYNLMPDIVFQFGLLAAVKDLCKKINNTGKLHMDFKVFHVKRKFKKNFEVEVFRVIQEIINNTIKHAEATNVEIQFVQQQDTLLITVEDNGKGFDYEKKLKSKTKGKGLLNIVNRIKLLHGTLRVESNKNQGTTYMVELPLIVSTKQSKYNQATLN